MAGIASAAAATSVDAGGLAAAVGALLATCVTVQQQAAVTDASCAGAFLR